MINPVITNLTTGSFLGLNLTLVSGDEVTIDTKNRTVMQGGTTNRMGSLTVGSTFWRLEPGDNTLTLTASAYDAGNASIYYRWTWEGI